MSKISRILTVIMIAGGTSKIDIVLYLYDITTLFYSNPYQFLLACDLQKNITKPIENYLATGILIEKLLENETFVNVQFCSRPRKAKILTTGIH